MNLTSDQAALLARVLADPADDMPRLVYADWLDDHGGGERAEFIRLQCDLAGLPAECGRTFCDGSLVVCPDCRRAKALKRRERELLGLGRDLWFSPPGMEGWTSGLDGGSVRYFFADYENEPHLTACWSRGFVSALTCDWPACRDHLDSIRREHPVEKVVLTSRPELRFSAIRYRTHDGPHGATLEARWVVRGEGVELDCGNGLSFSSYEARLARSPAQLRENFDRTNDRARTVEGFLRLRWPGVAFELPPEPDRRDSPFVTLLPRTRAAVAAREEATIAEHVAAAVRSEMQPGEHLEWVRQDFGDLLTRPVFQMHHECPDHQRVGYWSEELPSVENITFRVVELRRERFVMPNALGSASPFAVPVYRGGCPRCRTRYLAMGR